MHRGDGIRAVALGGLLAALLLLLVGPGPAGARALHFPLYVTKQGGSGYVGGTGVDDSIDCGTHCVAIVAQNTSLTLTASASNGFAFDRWGGDCSGTVPTCTLKVDGPLSVYAYFRDASVPPPTTTTGTTPTTPTATQPPAPPPPPPARVRLAVVKRGTGSGYVGGSGGVDCGPRCAATPFLGQDVQLVAVPDPGSGFAGWDGACHGDGPCTLTLRRAVTTITATFTRAVVSKPAPHRPAPPPPPPDLPVVHALPATAYRGRPASLRYTVWDRHGRTREEVTLASGANVLATYELPLRATRAGVFYAVRWRVPRDAPTGTVRFCVDAWDANDTPGKPSCATVDVR